MIQVKFKQKKPLIPVKATALHVILRQNGNALGISTIKYSVLWIKMAGDN